VGEWFRNADWDDDIEAAFDARLKRARDKAQYLNIQAYALLAVHPRAAARLCRRTIALNDPAQTARAGLYLGTALAVDGDLDGAISALEASIEAQRLEPNHRTAAYLDQALLVALAKRDDMYDIALERLEGEWALPISEQPLASLIAQALIGSERGQNVSAFARLALEILEQPDGDNADLPSCLSPAELRERLTLAMKT